MFVLDDDERGSSGGRMGMNVIIGPPSLFFLLRGLSSLTGTRTGEPCGGESRGEGDMELFGVIGVVSDRSGADAG